MFFIEGLKCLWTKHVFNVFFINRRGSLYLSTIEALKQEADPHRELKLRLVLLSGVDPR